MMNRTTLADIAAMSSAVAQAGQARTKSSSKGSRPTPTRTLVFKASHLQNGDFCRYRQQGLFPVPPA